MLALYLFHPSSVNAFQIPSVSSIAWQSLMADNKRSEEQMAASQDHHHQATHVDKKYGLLPKKKPLISKDHQRAFFDSADWALCKQGAGENPQPTMPIETLRPKLQRTPHQQLPPRRPACTS